MDGYSNYFLSRNERSRTMSNDSGMATIVVISNGRPRQHSPGLHIGTFR